MEEVVNVDRFKVFHKVVGDQKTYFILSNIIWVVAILTMTIILSYHSYKLVFDFIDQKPVVNMKYVDNSTDGIRLPNGTMCISFTRNIDNIDENNDLQRFLLEYYATTKYDAQSALYSLTPEFEFDNFVENILKEHNKSTYFDSLDNKTSAFWRIFCETIQLKMSIIDNVLNKIEKDYPICDMIANKMLPFTVNRFEHLCFRIPLEDFLFTKHILPLNSMSESQKTIPNSKDLTDLNRFSYYLTKIKFSVEFSTTMWERFSKQKLQSVYFYFPEQPISYMFQSEWDFKFAKETLDSIQFFYELDKKDCFKSFRSCHVNVEATIKEKYIGIKDNRKYTDVYDQRQCIINCKETELLKICGCRRYLLSHSATDPFCRYEDYIACVDMMNSSVAVKAKEESDACFEKCYKYTKLKFLFVAKEDYTKLSLPRTCGDIHTMLFPTLNITCQLSDSTDADQFVNDNPDFLQVMYGIYNNLEFFQNVTKFMGDYENLNLSLPSCSSIRKTAVPAMNIICQSNVSRDFHQIAKDNPKFMQIMYRIHKNLEIVYEVTEDDTKLNLSLPCSTIYEMVSPALNITCKFNDSRDLEQIATDNPVFMQIMYGIQFVKILAQANDDVLKLFCKLYPFPDKSNHLVKGEGCTNISTDFLKNVDPNKHFKIIQQWYILYDMLQPGIIFSKVGFRFFIGDFIYPQFTEDTKQSIEEVIAQIGGNIGMYLGISGLTIFACFVGGLRMLRKKWKKRQIELSKQTENVLSVLQFWSYWTVRQNSRKQQASLKRSSP